jgi:6-phosphofructokinase
MESRIAVRTSGGDAPGRFGQRSGWAATGAQMYGVRHGFAGLIAGRLIPLGPREVGGITPRGGTVLGSARCPEFMTSDGLEIACRTAFDRLLATRSAAGAIDALAEHDTGIMVGSCGKRKPLDRKVIRLADVLAA